MTSLRQNESPQDSKTIFSPTVIQTPTLQQLFPSLPELENPQNQSFSSVQRKKTSDEDYSPKFEVQKNSKKSKQLENRNVVPNIVRLILSFVQKPGKSSKLVDRLLKHEHCSTSTPKRYFLFQKLVKGKMDNYVNEETLGEIVRIRPEEFDIYSLEEQRSYSSVTRKLILYFLQREALNCIVTSKRMEQSKKRDHVGAIRSIITKLKVTLNP